ncbi:M48 family metallopeptidase [Candidatus Poribacteria bacterium]|nr:M48 family metallopeptidase [Candidatus Poribacteria bacterium]MYB64905.1 M48 family metallopeptidase [Candidatus Poribacteria bacterium]MYF56150.1 M48 family metallopeptidase [Candidatus Poribacteria bacterium]MYI93516.1 M48 family metallopeptidase [Candidatus Poribacteria bacterium]
MVHELVHLLVPKHGKLFKGYMSAYLPDWQERQESLKSL